MNPPRDALRTVELKVDRAAILAYAEITADFNPIHVDPAFAATTPMGQVIAHGTLSMNLIGQSIALSLGAARAATAELDIRFLKPVFVDDRVEAGGEPLADDPDGYRVWVRKRDGTVVIEGTARVPALSGACGPSCPPGR